MTMRALQKTKTKHHSKLLQLVKTAPVKLPFVFCVAIVITLLTVAVARGKNGNVIALLVIGYFYLLALTFFSARCYLWKQQSLVVSIKQFIRHLAFSIVCSILMEFLTLAGARLASPFHISDWSIVRFTIFFVLAYSIYLFFHMHMVSSSAAGNGINGDSHSSVLSRLKSLIRNNRVFLICVFVISCASVWCIFFSFALPLSVSAGALLFLCGVMLLFFIRSERPAPEKAFAAIALAIGFVIILAVPVSNLNSWDDEVHYSKALSLSYLVNPEQTASDRMVSQLFLVEKGFSDDVTLDRYPLDVHRPISQESIKQISCSLDTYNTRESISVHAGIDSAAASVAAFGYLPSAFGLWLARLLRLSFTSSYVLGRLFNLFFYVLVCFYAIKIVPVKKNILCTISLFPTLLFMAANYSYDPWVYSISLLAFSIFLREYTASSNLNWINIYLSLFLFFIAFLPKAVYFPIMGIVFLLLLHHKEDRECWIAIAIAGFLVILLIYSFLAPLMIPAAGVVEDLRGGPGVNSTLQIANIVNDPFGYLLLLLRFLFTGYLTVPFLEDSITNLAYFGSLNMLLPFFVGYITIYVISISILDSDSISASLCKSSSRIWCLFIFFSTLSLVSTALYISFTEVGSSTIAGVQARYILPLLPILFVFVVNAKVRISISRSVLFRINSLACFTLNCLAVFLLVISKIC